VRGEISLYQDELRGHWPPLPFYVYGTLQTLTGPSLLSGRLLACVIGALVLALVFLLATRWAGRWPAPPRPRSSARTGS
jgi:4-amino-4-deoxy-L-arabinose transferase-like glycosyltransferase